MLGRAKKVMIEERTPQLSEGTGKTADIDPRQQIKEKMRKPPRTTTVRSLQGWPSARRRRSYPRRRENETKRRSARDALMTRASNPRGGLKKARAGRRVAP